MRGERVKVQGAACVAVLCSGIGAVVMAGTPSAPGLTLAAPEVLRLVHDAPAALSSYPAIRMTGTYTYSLNGQTIRVTASALVTPDGQRGTETVAVPTLGKQFTFTAINHKLYVHLPTARGGQHYAWCELPTHSTSGLGVGTGGTDPLAYIQMMPGATGRVKVVGRKTIDGASTTEYQIDIDLRVALQRLGQDGHASAGSVQQLQNLGITTMPFDVWIDAQKAVRQFGWHVSAHGFSTSARWRVSGSTTPPTVTEPAPSDAYYVDSCNQLPGAAAP